MKDYIKIPEIRLKQLKSDQEGLKKLQELSNTKISFDEGIEIEGDSLPVYQTKQVLKAFGRGLTINDSLYLLDDSYGLEVIDISELVRSKERIKVLKGRIIGTKGKTKKMIERYTGTKISVFGKTISILGEWDKINVSKEAVLLIIKGVSHKKLYRWLEQQYSRI